MQNQYAQVVIDITSPDLDRTFEYLVPEQLRDRVVVSGNTSLAAAEKLVMEGTAGLHDYDTFRKDMQTLQFAGDSEYESCFYESMTLTNRRI